MDTKHGTRRGASLATYALVVGLVAVIAAVTVTRTGDQSRGLTARVAQSVNAVDGALAGNAGPVFDGTLPPDQTVLEYDSLQVVEITGFNDPEGDPLSFELIVGGALDPAGLSTTPLADGLRITGTPSASGTLAVLARDPLSRTAESGAVTITVTPNRAPAAATLPGDVTVTAGETVSLVYDGVDDPDGDTVEVAAIGAAGASAILTGTQAEISWTPTAGTHTPVLEMTDAHDLSASTPPVTVRVLARSCQDYKTADPSATDGVYTIDPDGTGPLAPFDVECEMDAQGRGWTVVTWIDAFEEDDGLIGYSQSNSNGLTQCLGDQYAHFDDVPYTDVGAGNVDPNPGWRVYNGTGWPILTSENTLTWLNPATGGAFAADQLAALRAQITELSPETRMHAVKCDCDYEDHQDGSYTDFGEAHDARILDANGNALLLTPGKCEPNNNTAYAAYYLMGTDAAASAATDGVNDQGTDAIQLARTVLPQSMILPSRVDLAKGSGGGVIWGYEKRRVRVR